MKITNEEFHVPVRRILSGQTVYLYCDEYYLYLK